MINKDFRSDQQLLDAMRIDDSLAFRILYERYWQSTLYFACKKTSDLMTAEDIVQDIFVSLWSRRHTLVITANLSHYLMVCIKYRLIKILDKQRRVRLEEDMMALDVLDNSTQEMLDFDELRSKLELLIVALPEKYQVVYRLHKEEHLSHQEIAQRMKLSEQAVNSRLVRARKTLSTGLQDFFCIFFL